MTVANRRRLEVAHHMGLRRILSLARQNYKQKHKVEDGTEGYREVREHHQEKKIKGARPRVSHGQKSQLGNALDS